MLHVAVDIDDDGLLWYEITLESILVPVWCCDVEILLATVENEVVVVIRFLLLLCFQCFHHFLDPFIQFRWWIAQRCAHANHVSQILIGWINFILDVVSNMAANGMSDNWKLLLFIGRHYLVDASFDHICLILEHRLWKRARLPQEIPFIGLKTIICLFVRIPEALIFFPSFLSFRNLI